MGNTPTVFEASNAPTPTSAEDIDTYFAVVKINGTVVVPDLDFGGTTLLTGQRGWFFEGRIPEGEGKHWTSWRFDLYPTPDYEGIDPFLNNVWASHVNRLISGKHAVEITLRSGNGVDRSAEPIARGSFTLEKTSDVKVTRTATCSARTGRCTSFAGTAAIRGRRSQRERWICNAPYCCSGTVGCGESQRDAL